jgi:hypothetical protein
VKITRIFFVVCTALGLSFWASAQHQPSGPSAPEQLKLLQANQELLQGLLADALRLTSADTTLNRATECHKAAQTIATALEKSAASPSAEPSRIAELGEHFTKLLKDGLAPTLAEARSQITPGSRDYPRLKELHEQTRQSLTAIQKVIPTSGPVGEARTVVQLRESLATLSDQFTMP